MLTNKFNLNEYELKVKATELRMEVIRMLMGKPSGHTGGPLGMADVFACLYFNILKYDSLDYNNDDRDRLLLSNGHICPILYVCLDHAGFFPKEELSTFRELGSRLQGHPHNLTLPMIENSSGPLGEGISQSVGFALRAKMDKKDYRVFALGSDGENQEGQFWESLLFASKQKLDNLFIIVDKNNIEIDGFLSDIEPIDPLREKYIAFNFDVYEMDGNDIKEIMSTLNEAISNIGNSKPKIIIANTILGKGVPFMENKYEWHGKPPTKEEGMDALKYLESLL